jgi:hypothetical protein
MSIIRKKIVKESAQMPVVSVGTGAVNVKARVVRVDVGDADVVARIVDVTAIFSAATRPRKNRSLILKNI